MKVLKERNYAMKKNFIRIVLFLMVMIMAISTSVFAHENIDNVEAVKQEDVKTIEQLEKLDSKDITLDVLKNVGTVDYYNAETGEYLVWEDKATSQLHPMAKAPGSIAKKFSFRITHSVKSKDPFTIKSTKAKVKIHSVKVVNPDDKEIKGYTGYKYCVDLLGGLRTKTINLYVNQQSTGVADGLSKGKKYTLKVRNPGEFNGAGRGTRYLKGNGTLYNI